MGQGHGTKVIELTTGGLTDVLKQRMKYG